MELFYCEKCEKWYDLDESHTILLREATEIDPEQWSDELYCNKCNTEIHDDHRVDDVIEMLNNTSNEGLKWII